MIIHVPQRLLLTCLFICSFIHSKIFLELLTVNRIVELILSDSKILRVKENGKCILHRYQRQVCMCIYMYLRETQTHILVYIHRQNLVHSSIGTIY